MFILLLPVLVCNLDNCPARLLQGLVRGSCCIYSKGEFLIEERPIILERKAAMTGHFSSFTTSYLLVPQVCCIPPERVLVDTCGLTGNHYLRCLLLLFITEFQS